MAKPTQITVVIPTLGQASRRDSLERAIESVLSQRDVVARPLVVLNGDRFDPKLRESLSSRLSNDLIYESVGSLPNAHRVGVRAVRSPYFSFLDDDDYLLPHGLFSLLTTLLANPNATAAVGNGYVHGTDTESLHLGATGRRIDTIRADPLASLVEKNWLASCGALYRSDRAREGIFDGRVAHLEWTYYAARLALDHEVCFTETPVFSVTDSPESASKSLAYALGHTFALEMIASILQPRRPEIAQRFRQRLAQAYNVAALELAEVGRYREAIAAQLRCITRPGGLAYAGVLPKLIARAGRSLVR